MVKDRHDPQAAQMRRAPPIRHNWPRRSTKFGLTKGLEERPPPRPPD